ncbi:MAG: alpha/beta hydrolase [Patescibacteria group bacterium]
MKQLLFIHGGEIFAKEEDALDFLASLEIDPNEDKAKRWKHYLAEDLGDDWQVYAPEMPNKLDAKYGQWKIWFEKYIPYLKDGVVLVGHSLGAMFLARYLSEQRLPVQVSKLFLLSGECVPNECVEKGGRGGSFYPEMENIEVLEDSAWEIYIVHSRDDPVVPYAHALRWKECLPKAKMVSFEDKGHFLHERFPELIELILA